MKSVELLPSEIWQSILRYAIAVPVFFEANPADLYGIEEIIKGYDDNKIYWESERVRNTLRRVCSAWNDYLKQYSNRFVRLLDVMHGTLPYSAIPNAIRLDLEPCFCAECWDNRLQDPDWAYLLQKAAEEVTRNWAVEIIEGSYGSSDDFSHFAARTPALKAILRSTRHSMQEGNYISQVSTFQALEVPQFMKVDLQARYLTTLRLEIISLSICPAWQLPSLRHFSFFAQEVDPINYIETLKAIGSGLITLFDTSGNRRGYELPSETWQICPRLERFQTSLSFSLSNPLPGSLRLVRFRVTTLTRSIEPSETIFPIKMLQSAGVKGIAFDLLWGDIIEYIESGIMEYVVAGMDCGLVVRDDIGVTFQEFLVSLLSSPVTERKSVLDQTWRAGELFHF